MKLETVRVAHPDLPGGVLINKSDFDPKLHELLAEPDAPKALEEDPQDSPPEQEPNEGQQQNTDAPKVPEGEGGAPVYVKTKSGWFQAPDGTNVRKGDIPAGAVIKEA